MGLNLRVNIATMSLMVCFLYAANPPVVVSEANLMNRTQAHLERAYEESLRYQFEDGVTIKVHFTPETLTRNGANDYFPREVLNAAVLAYQTITQFQSFSTPGFSFAAPNKKYAYDSDRTIDIYLGDPSDGKTIQAFGSQNLSFKDAPCFDTLKLSETRFEAIILLPSNYHQFIKNWERINPSSLGPRNIEVDLRGTLIHEMLHVVLFYYNKNLNNQHDAVHKTDWYVEGLARYFETFAGARHDFFSQGFKQMLPGKVRFSRGGSNYFMRYPDQAFTDLRYENALFWRFIDYRYGIAAIESLSRDFRKTGVSDPKTALEKVTGVPFKELLKKFATHILFKDFGLKDDAHFLKDIARTRLLYKNENLYLKDGFEGERFLGKRCQTDWIGRWENAQASFGDAAIAGDSSEKSDVSGWATDFYQIELDDEKPDAPNLSVMHQGKGLELAVQLAIKTKGGSVLMRELGPISRGKAGVLALDAILASEGLSAADVDKLFILITNLDPALTTDYEIIVNPTVQA